MNCITDHTNMSQNDNLSMTARELALICVEIKNAIPLFPTGLDKLIGEYAVASPHYRHARSISTSFSGRNIAIDPTAGVMILDYPLESRVCVVNTRNLQILASVQSSVQACCCLPKKRQFVMVTMSNLYNFETLVTIYDYACKKVASFRPSEIKNSVILSADYDQKRDVLILRAHDQFVFYQVDATFVGVLANTHLHGIDAVVYDDVQECLIILTKRVLSIDEKKKWKKQGLRPYDLVWQSTDGQLVRRTRANFIGDPDISNTMIVHGSFLFIASQCNDSVTVFDRGSGELLTLFDCPTKSIATTCLAVIDDSLCVFGRNFVDVFEH